MAYASKQAYKLQAKEVLTRRLGSADCANTSRLKFYVGKTTTKTFLNHLKTQYFQQVLGPKCAPITCLLWVLSSSL